MLQHTYPFELPPLPYAYSALEPWIDTETMLYHHDRHFQTYIDNLNKAVEAYPALQRMTLTQLLRGNFRAPPKDRTVILNNAGGVYNHALFFDGLSPAGSGRHVPRGALLSGIESTWGTFEAFKSAFKKQALDVFGSGWTVLAVDSRDRLRIVNVKNQETTVPLNLETLVLVDVWEHAYYLKYKNMRAEYLDNIWNVLDFPDLDS